jgi:hypothetical protein
MTAIARALSYSVSDTRFEIDSLKTICLFCGVGLTASLFPGRLRPRFELRLVLSQERPRACIC